MKVYFMLDNHEDYVTYEHFPEHGRLSRFGQLLLVPTLFASEYEITIRNYVYPHNSCLTSTAACCLQQLGQNTDFLPGRALTQCKQSVR